jgi:predicted GNAT family N-acyltransferase
MTVRHDVFVKEQNCAADAERDEDDARSWEFVIYAKKPQGEHAQEEMKEEEEEEKPVAVVRLVPPPHAPHDTLHDPARASEFPRFDTVHEPYVKVTRVAVLKEFRGLGLAGRVMRVAEEWAAANKEAIDAMYRRVAGDIQQQPKGWNGLVGLHAQVQVEKMYQRMGYEKDGSLGTWDEEGIQHVGMFKRVALN